MTLAADKKVDRRVGVLMSLLVAAATKIYAGALVALNSSGYAIPATDAVGNTFAGVARSRVDNSAGSAGDLAVEVYQAEEWLLDITDTITAADVGRPVYVYDDNSVGLYSTYGVYVGVITEYDSANKAWVRLDKLPSAEEPVINVPVAATGNIAAGDLVAVNAAGYALPGADTAGLVFMGIAEFARDNGSGANGDLSVPIRKPRFDRMTSAGMAQANVGDKVYLNGATAVALAATTTNDVEVGTIRAVESATVILVELS